MKCIKFYLVTSFFNYIIFITNKHFLFFIILKYIILIILYELDIILIQLNKLVCLA